MGFIDAYKRLEKICGEILNDDRRVSAYIDEMRNTPRGSFYVRTWKEDLEKLKHYRWIRNQISHEPGCTEQNMCEPADEVWLEHFYTRIMNQTDPLTQYRKATAPRVRYEKVSSAPVKVQNDSAYMRPNAQKRRSTDKLIGCLAGLISFFVLLAIITLILYVT